MNNKGMAISSILYTILILFLALLFGILGLISSAKTTFDALKEKLYTDLNDGKPQVLFIADLFDNNMMNLKIISRKYIDLYYLTTETEEQDDADLNSKGTRLTAPSGNFMIPSDIDSDYYILYLKDIHSNIYKYLIQIQDAGTDDISGSVVFMTDNTVIPEHQIEYAFKQLGLCTFNGTSSTNTNVSSPNITGEQCQNYTGSNYINTNVQLFNTENWTKDFDLTVNIDNYGSSLITQAVIVGEMKETSNIGQTGFVVRLASKKQALEMIFRKDAKNSDYVTITTPSLSEKLKIIRRNQKICYSVDDGPLSSVIFDYSDVSNKYFNIPVYFGADTDSDSETTPRRIFNGDLSNMTITFDVDSSLVCSN